MGLSVQAKANVYSGNLLGKLIFLKRIAARVSVAATVTLFIRLIQGKIANVSYRFAERFATHKVQCPCCGWTGVRFRTIFFGSYLRQNCGCPGCKSLERHRSYYLYYSGRAGHSGLGEVSDKVILYFAPEVSLYVWLQKKAQRVIRADLFARDIDLRANLGSLPVKNACIDVVINHHVLEHLPSDVAALEEFERILKPGGALFISVPINEDRQLTTDWGFPDPVQQDHFREYGLDFPNRLARFECTPINIPSGLSREDNRRYGLAAREVVFSCRKPISDKNSSSPKMPC